MENSLQMLEKNASRKINPINCINYFSYKKITQDFPENSKNPSSNHTTAQLWLWRMIRLFTKVKIAALVSLCMSLKFNFVKCDMIIPRFFFCVKFPAKCIWLAAILLMGQNPTLFTSGYFCHHYCIIVEATLFVWDKYTNVNMYTV